VDVQERLDELAVLIEDAKAMPLSASCIVNRQQVLDLIGEIRDLLPESVQRADELLADREAVVQDGRREADRILDRARTEADRLVSEHEVYLAAVAESDALTEQTARETARMRKETDDYIDAKLATFEITLQKTLQTVDRGRERLRSQMYQELAPAGQQVYDDAAYADGGYADGGYADAGYPEPGQEGDDRR
jgi:F0F1-type ATP synthase membrane subunit b/b'